MPIPVKNASGATVSVPTLADVDFAEEATLSAINTKTPDLVSGAVPVTGPVTDTQIRATPLPVSGPLTDTQLRAVAVPVSGPLTDTQLRAVAVPISAAALPLPSGAATAAGQTTQATSLGNLDTNIGAKADAAATTDTGTFSLIALFKRWFSKLPSVIGQRTMADSLSVVHASDMEVYPQTSGSVTATGTIIASQDVRGYGSFAVQLTGTWVGTVQIQCSNDNTNWVAIPNYQLANADATLSTTANGMFHASIVGQYIRVQCTAYTSGTIVATAVLSRAATMPFAGAANITRLNGGLLNTGTGNSASGTLRVWIANDNIPSTTPFPQAAVGANSLHMAISAASTNATSVKASGGVLNSLTVSNNAATPSYLKLYNKASAPTVGTDTPVMTILVGPSQTVCVDCGYCGIRMNTGIAYALVTGIAVANTTAVGASEIAVNINYT